MQGLLNKLLNILTEQGYIKHKLWHSSELTDRKQRNTSTKLVGSRQKFDDFEKVNVMSPHQTYPILNTTRSVFVHFFSLHLEYIAKSI